ncbi:hypothetical protein KOW79_008072 [Hemibagrus wyckioides]|uniref:Uncharacterized protein n=1 Tax=Hemibagrus wyckioides TaxID=337641 RepID=A0A9D3SQT4_9TELE|nr:hypothetical protein KOW79_008072 [Hemibagrus wyckioides]
MDRGVLLVAAALQSQSRLGGVVEQRQKGSGVNENTLPGLFSVGFSSQRKSPDATQGNVPEAFLICRRGNL